MPRSVPRTRRRTRQSDAEFMAKEQFSATGRSLPDRRGRMRIRRDVRRECLDHVIVFTEMHLRRILGKSGVP
jgi:hypothetical protein